MNKAKHVILGIAVVALCVAVLVGLIRFTSQSASSLDLTGVWLCDDGGTYYIRQLGSSVYWYGENNPVSPQWSNVAYGKLDGDILVLMWADVPKGTNRVHGILVLRVGPNAMSVIQKTGGFGGNRWWR